MGRLWAVEKIMEVRRVAMSSGRSRLEARVRWVGDEHEDSWEPARNLHANTASEAERLEIEKYGSASAMRPGKRIRADGSSLMAPMTAKWRGVLRRARGEYLTGPPRTATADSAGATATDAEPAEPGGWTSSEGGGSEGSASEDEW